VSDGITRIEGVINGGVALPSAVDVATRTPMRVMAGALWPLKVRSVGVALGAIWAPNTGGVGVGVTTGARTSVRPGAGRALNGIGDGVEDGVAVVPWMGKSNGNGVLEGPGLGARRVLRID
jgi:hypothetical protein